ncbi:hypothetical protein DY000_02017905 [Brassica cretica]|uniref:FLZ-type domain-containing protein n=1 Tax=Brassica cretica TaxID=69181 RepID=A0ABQ7CMU4_BRACR|nr:hypothetical protein DY000_02017905 [Brassica cretica]
MWTPFSRELSSRVTMLDSVFCETTLTALLVSTRIFVKIVPASSNVMTRASSWGMSSLAVSYNLVFGGRCFDPSCRGRFLTTPVFPI